jgi:hypothetical protein
MLTAFSDSEESDSEEEKKAKSIPSWAKDPLLRNSLISQQFANPDKIFPEVYSCDLEGLLQSKSW